MNNLFLIWDLEITPSDKNVGIIKSKSDIHSILLNYLNIVNE